MKLKGKFERGHSRRLVLRDGHVFFLGWQEKKKDADEEEGNREGERRDEVLLHLESCRHICSSMMSALQPSAVILDRSQVEQRYRLAACLSASHFNPEKLACLSTTVKCACPPTPLAFLSLSACDLDFL